jgi:hypothetical protein
MFSEFKQAVARQYEQMKGNQFYRTDVEKEMLWLTYLESFPEGSNPMMRERTEHDCQACKSFIRAVGSMVTVKGNKLVSLWDCRVGEPYATVAAAMAELVTSAPIKNVLLHDQKNAGVDKNHQDGENGVITWEHFHLVLPPDCVSQDRGSIYGEKRSTMEVFRRALEEITLDAIETVVELIDQGSLYRGEEHLHSVQSFLKQKKAFDKLKSAQKKDIFVWRQDLGPAVTRIRNSAIGTLLVDLSEDKPLDEAVKMFESKVAPANYKRPKALVTKAMVQRARKVVQELGYESALGRRFAVAGDITVNNVLFANRDARRAMDTDVFDEIISETSATPLSKKELDRIEDVPIEKFIEDILPKATSVELLLENRHNGNMVNLVAPSDPDAPSMLKWSNNFTWSYQGDVADSIKQRVKAAGGNVTGDFRASLAWWNYDDLDLHMREPGPRGGHGGGHHIYYSSKNSPYTGGALDVDMNAGSGTTRKPVENITYPQRSRMHEGIYELQVHQYALREHKDIGFEVELEFDGETYTFAYNQEVRQSQYVTVAKFKFTQKGGIEFIDTLPRQNVQKEIWGVRTQVFHPVSMIMLSPNHWNGRPVGNKHYFFMIQDCHREGSSRGFFNEQLSDDLREHRKVFEILGSKMRTEDEGEQLSGLGFSSTRRNNVRCKVTGAFTRTINIVF